MAHHGWLTALLRLAGGMLALVALAAFDVPRAGAETLGSLSGKVTEATTHQPIAEISVCAAAVNSELLNESESEHIFECQKTGAGGEYTLGELRPETYDVFFTESAGSTLDFIPQFYDGKSLESEATPVIVKAGANTPEVDAELSLGGEIAGTVTSASTGAAVDGAVVCAAKEGAGGSLAAFGCGESEASGGYTIRGLESGEYELFFFADGFAPGWYDSTANRDEARMVSVTAPNLTTVGEDSLTPGSALTLPGGPTSTSGSGTGSKVPGSGTSTAPAAGTLTLRADRASVLLDGETLLKLACSGSAACRGKITLRLQRTVKVKGKKVKRAITLGTSPVVSLAAGRQGTVEIKLDAKARRVLRADDGRLKVQMTLVTPHHVHTRSLQLVERARRSS